MTTDTPQEKPGQGAPKHNKNARKHGLHSAKAFFTEFGQRAIDGRSAVARAMVEFKESIVKDLGGLEALTAGKKVILDKAIVTKFLLDGIDNHLMSKGSAALFSNRGRSLSSIVRERQVLADSLVRQLQVLGLEVVQPKAPDLASYLKSKSQENAQ